MLIFTMTPDIACEFWERVAAAKADTLEARTEILLRMADEGIITSVSKTDRSKSEYIKDIGKEFKVMEIKNED